MAIVNQNFRNALANITKAENIIPSSLTHQPMGIFDKETISDIPGSLTHRPMGIFGKETINNIPTSVAS